MKNQIIRSDFIIIGSGIAGLTAALQCAEAGTVSLLTKKKLADCATDLAQGGIAAALNKGDKPAYHLQDTLIAGAGLCRKKAVRILVEEGVLRVRELIKMGTPFDKHPEGEFDFTKEGVHSKRRVLHAGDSTGHEIERILIKHTQAVKNIKIYEHTQALELLVTNGRCFGAYACDTRDHTPVFYLASATILATGGIAQIYAQNTHPTVCTGDGIAMAYRAGVPIENIEFIQFHPTTLYTTEKKKEMNPLFLISEATRGEGAVLRNVLGEHFMPKYHPMSDLAPRDVVSRAILREMRKTLSDHVFLDFSKVKGSLSDRFPTIYAHCKKAGFDIKKVLLPVAPAAHYLMGGIKADVFGQTRVRDLYAAGETASVGVHGANRLASNSLLDGLVFGRRAAQRAIMKKQKNLSTTPDFRTIETYFSDIARTFPLDRKIATEEREKIKQLMWFKAGIIRKTTNLEEVGAELNEINEYALDPETMNMLLTSKLVVAAALKRTESRGAHYRLDHPRPRFWWKRSSITKQ